MPSSLIFAGLVVLWLLILVPAIARHQHEVARPSVAALSGRVLARPQRRHSSVEVDDVDDSPTDSVRSGPVLTDPVPTDPVPTGSVRADSGRTAMVATRVAQADVPRARAAADAHEPEEPVPEDELWERPAPRFRPGRGGFDPQAAALTARARYAFRQRVVLGLLIAAAVTAVLALVVGPGLWWLHGAVDLALVGYLVHLRREVRMEEAIRDRRAARMAGTRTPQSAEDPELDEWARRGRAVSARPVDPRDGDDDLVDCADDEDADEEDEDLVDDGTERVSGTGEPVGPIVSRGEDPGEEPALPRLAPAPPPALPAGTTLVDGDLDDPELHELDAPARPTYRRAVGE